MHPYKHAETAPDKIAYLMADTGEKVTYGQLDERSNQIAQLFRSKGLKKGDTIALFASNSARYFEIAWGAQRSGLYFACISSRLSAPEVQYIVEDSGARFLIASSDLANVAKETKAITNVEGYWSIDGDIEDYERFEDLAAAMPATPISDQSGGTDMLYSSGTTGRPKGIRPPLDPDTAIDEDNALRQIAAIFCGISEDSTYISPAPLYHAAPLRWCMSVHRIGGTIIVMRKFEPEEFLALVEEHNASHTQMVPTMFVRMLKLPDEARLKYDVSSMQFAVHAAAPCPIPVKEKMIEWWGPVIHEYYAGSEGNGMTWINSEDWLAHKGSVGKPVLGEPHICDESGAEVPIGDEGVIYFSGAAAPTYHNDTEKTKGALNPMHPEWSTLGDVGRMDEDGFLYLTDRKAFMIISGGVNIYPQEAENALITHPKVTDCAVIGVPNEDFGEEVKAVVQPADMSLAGPELEAELIEYCQSQLSKIKCPRSIDFDPELPRHPTGKLYKRLIRDRYWGKKDSRIV